MKRTKRPIGLAHTLANDTIKVPGPLATQCRIWKWSSNGKYGHTWHRGHYIGAHRFFYEKKHGPVPRGLELDHLCKQKKCCNHSHMEAVTSAQNIQRSPVAKIDLRQVVMVREYYQRCKERGKPFPQRAVAKALGIAECTLWQMRTGVSWKTP